MRSPDTKAETGNQGVENGEKSNWPLGFGGREIDNRNQGRSDGVKAVVLVSRRGKKSCLVDEAC